MLLKINKNSLTYEQRIISCSGNSVTVNTNGCINNDLKSYDVTFITNSPHGLKIGDKVLYTYKLNNSGNTKTISLSVNEMNYSDTSFTIRLNCWQEIIITQLISYTNNNNTYYAVNFDGDISSCENTGNTYNLYLLTDNFPITVTARTENLFTTTASGLYEGQKYYLKDNLGVNESGLTSDYCIQEQIASLNISIPMNNSDNIDSNNEDISNHYFKEKKKELIPEIIDYEKRCFTPVYGTGDTLSYLTKIRFNLFFRDRGDKKTRLNNEWVSDDTKGWNQCTINTDGTINPTTAYTKGDLLTYLNFNDEDVFYRKKKLSKSFLRLSFYNSINPLNQMLLFYSTVFFDSGNAYKKYMNRIEEKISGSTSDTIYSLVENICNNYDDENNITASFVINDRFNNSASSEGFYLYLFPDGLNENSGKTIYMKVEFNHAGYGRTLPFILPTSTGDTILNFSDSNFPEHLINDNGDLSEYYRQLYIPITVKYDSVLKDYVYHFENTNLNSPNNNGELEINLYEPKINSIEA